MGGILGEATNKKNRKYASDRGDSDVRYTAPHFRQKERTKCG